MLKIADTYPRGKKKIFLNFLMKSFKMQAKLVANLGTLLRRK